MSRTILFESGKHRNILLEDFSSGGLAVQANQHIIVDGDAAMILDPGGHKVYSKVMAATKQVLGRAQLETIFLSHQDPDPRSSCTPGRWTSTSSATGMPLARACHRRAERLRSGASRASG